LGLLGDLRQRRLLQLGWEGPEQALTLVKAGAALVVVDPSSQAIGSARRLSDSEEVKLDLHQGDIADLAFLRADSMDFAYASGALSRAQDLRRVFRQVNRVLRPGGVFLVRVGHPVAAMLDATTEPPSVRQSYFSGTLSGSPSGRVWTVEEIFSGLAGNGFEVDSLIEMADADRPDSSPGLYPELLLVRAKKKGA
jgi:SAM-dependent methyltransferase